VLGLDEDVTDSSAVAGAESLEVVSLHGQVMGRCSSSDDYKFQRLSESGISSLPCKHLVYNVIYLVAMLISNI
jgi:hypothetical protein